MFRSFPFPVCLVGESRCTCINMALPLTNIPKRVFYSLMTNERIFLVLQTKSKAKLEVSEGRERRIEPIYSLGGGGEGYLHHHFQLHPVILLLLRPASLTHNNLLNNNWKPPVRHKDRSIDLKMSLQKMQFV